MEKQLLRNPMLVLLLENSVRCAAGRGPPLAAHVGLRVKAALAARKWGPLAFP